MPTIAILGASNNRAKIGNKAVRAFVQQGWTVFPVNPKEAAIEGLTAFKNVADIHTRLDRVSVYLPPAVTLKLLPEIAAQGCGEFWLNPGAESPEVLIWLLKCQVGVDRPGHFFPVWVFSRVNCVVGTEPASHYDGGSC